MRTTLGTPQGRNILVHNPKLFQDPEEVIIFQKDEFARTYKTMADSLKEIERKYYKILPDDNYPYLPGFWNILMERVHIIASSCNFILEEPKCQSFLDSYMAIESEQEVFSSVKSIDDIIPTILK